MTTQQKPILPERVFDFDSLVHEDRVHRSLYTDPAIFDLEMTRIFGAVWVYLAHESQVPQPNDFVRARLGRRPLIVVRDSNGVLRALYNRCTHRGATVCRRDRGSAKAFQCPYHGWTYLNTGKLSGVPWPEGYSCDFSRPEFNLMQVPRVESYRGLIFATLNADAPALTDYLGPVRRPLDEWLDRHPGGEIAVREADAIPKRPGALWAIERLHPGMEHYEAALRRDFPDRADAFLDLASSEPVNINVFPNLHILGNHIQVSEPLSVTETATTWYGTAVVDPDGELGAALGPVNALRMRTQEQFPTFGEVDDLANFEQIQAGLAAEEDAWIYMHRGLGLPERYSDGGGGTTIGPATDEVFMRDYMRVYRRLMQTEPAIVPTRETG